MQKPPVFPYFFWPILWALAAACTSFCGLKSLSTKITVSAAVRLIPTPPWKIKENIYKL